MGFWREDEMSPYRASFGGALPLPPILRIFGQLQRLAAVVREHYSR